MDKNGYLPTQFGQTGIILLLKYFEMPSKMKKHDSHWTDKQDLFSNYWIFQYLDLLIYLFYLFIYLLSFRATPEAYGGSQARH